MLISSSTGKTNQMTSHRPRAARSMRRLMLFAMLVLALASFGPASSKPQQQQHQQRSNPTSTASDHDKQLLRKALEASSDPPSAQTFQCPEQFGYYTDTRDCTKYFVCVFGEVLHESCTGGLRFSRELQTCDWPRNVECPQLNGSSSAPSTTASPQTTTTATSTTLTATTTSGLATFQATPTYHHQYQQQQQQQQQQQASSAANSNSNINLINKSSQSINAKNQQDSSGAGQDAGHQHARSSAGLHKSSSASMVFADEGSDPQQPSFDEAVSPVITSDGTIHLHDGSGGTFSLTPNHNRQQQPQQATDGERRATGNNNNVDVFVKPLAAVQPTNGAGGNAARRQQLIASSSINGNQNGVRQPGNSKLQAASLPVRQPIAGNQFGGGGNANDHSNRDDLNSPTAALDVDSLGQEEPGEGNNEQPATTTLDSISSQADLELNENQSEAAQNGQSAELAATTSRSGNEPDSDYSGEPPARAQQTQAGPAGYIPPVMAPNTLRQAGGNSLALASGRQQAPASQLLAINNRQVVDSSRQSFKPVNLQQLGGSGSASGPFKSAGHQQQQSSSAMDGSNQFQASSDQRREQQLAREEFHPPAGQADGAGSQGEPNSDLELDDERPQQPAPVRSLNGLQQRPGVNQGNSWMNGNQTAQLLARQQLASLAAQAIQNNNNGGQNNRQARLLNASANQKQQFSGLQATGNSNNNNRLLSASVEPSNRFSPSQQQLSSNVNFNDSSKLIRLQASQFQPLEQPGESGFSSNAGQASNKPQQSSRSQSVLFSQQPFGFAGHEGGPDGDFRGATGADSQAANANNNQLPANSLLQQQRRPRPPKRQQIPSGPPSPNLSARGRQNQFSEIDTTTTTTTTSSLLASSQPTTNSFLSAQDARFLSEPAENGDQPTATTATATRSNGLLGQQRPIVAPTMINFQQGDQHPMLGALSNQAAPANRQRSFNDELVRPRQNSRLSGQPASAGVSAGLGGGLGSQGQQPTSSGGHRASTVGSQRGPLSSQQLPSAGQNRNAQLMADLLLPPTSDSDAPTTVPVTQPSNSGQTATTAPAGGEQPDPQLVANRYLNSAIDALEAGQPFGTVDYDFDILNDNSTDRRGANANSSPSQAEPSDAGDTGFQPAAANQTVPAFSVNPAGGGRQRQQAFAAGSGNGASQSPNRANNNQEEGENISLTNGQPKANGANLSPRPSQQQRNRSAAQGNRQAQFSQPSQGINHQQPPITPTTTTTAAAASNQQQQQPTKKPRPTNRKIVVNHEQALANNRASQEPAKRPEALFQTPTALQTASKCDNRVCRLPDCKCGDTQVPGSLDPKTIPQVILLTFDDAVNDLNWEIYEELFTGRTNPNGCPILATFYVSHEWTDYGQVQTLYSRGHEMASHSVTHSFGEKFSKNQWFKEVNGQREILNMYGGVKMNDVRGMRAPFLQIGGNKMFEMLYDANFTYDSSMPIFENSPPLWPYTLDYQLTHECMITPCPTKSFPGVWEVGMTMWVDLRGGRCSMGDACSNPQDEDGVYEMLMKNFNRHYKSNRAPFGLFYHSAWFNTVHHRRGFLKFMGTVNSLSDVFFVTNWQMLQWMRQPTPLSEINSFEPWQCPAKNDRPPPCFHPSVCNVKSEHGTRFMKTCQPCPANQQYPWVGATGFKAKQAANGNGSG